MHQPHKTFIFWVGLPASFSAEADRALNELVEHLGHFMFCVDVTGIIADRNNSVQTIKKAVHRQIQLLAARSLFPIKVQV